jgi:Fe-S-cluster containining protein
VTLSAVASVAPQDASPCRSCGACCSFAPDWPRFTLEDDADLQRIPGRFVAADLSGMRCDGNRCSALRGEVGVATSCAVYEVRPDVCRACEPGDDACAMARRRSGLNALAA